MRIVRFHRRYYYGSAGYPDAYPFPAHIVAANADDLGELPPLFLV